ncbi:MAK10-like protein [Tanacetum coccineum]
MQEYMASYTKRIERFKRSIFKQRDEINGRMAEMFGLLKELTSSETPKKEKRSIEEPVRIASNEPLGEEKKIIEPPEPQPVSHYLKHIINKELIKGLVENQRFNDYLLAMQLGKMECKDYHSLPKEPMRKVMLNKRLTDEKLVETDIRLSLASQSHIYPLGITEDVLVKIDDFVYPVDFVILDIKEDRKKPFILGMLFLTTARSKIKFDKGTIALKSGRSKIHFHKCPEPFYKFKERKEDKVEPLSIVIFDQKKPGTS